MLRGEVKKAANNSLTIKDYFCSKPRNEDEIRERVKRARTRLESEASSFSFLFLLLHICLLNSYSVLQRGSFHALHCEDALFHSKLHQHLHLIAVMDGCTMGKDSVFAAFLLKKYLAHQARSIGHQLWRSPDALPQYLPELLSYLLVDLHQNLRGLQNQLMLEKDELLSTLVVGVIDPQHSLAEFAIVGDGVVIVDGKTFAFDQGDRPDYLAYHLTEDPHQWVEKLEQRLSFTSWNDLSIATDGIESFRCLHSTSEKKAPRNVVHEMGVNQDFLEYPNALVRKVMHLEEAHQLIPTDDLAMLRVRRGIAAREREARTREGRGENNFEVVSRKVCH